MTTTERTPALGYTALFNAIGDAVKVEWADTSGDKPRYGIGISVEAFEKSVGGRVYLAAPIEAGLREKVDLEALCAALLDGVGCTPWSSPTWDNDGTDGASREGVRASVRRVISALQSEGARK